jgi:predicted DCC family thiol-disulfide oxidoreductase YuxK
MTMTITGERPQVRALTVLYDDECPVCRGAKRWLQLHRHVVPVRFAAVGSPRAIAMFPTLDQEQCRSTVTLVTDAGYVYRGDDAWIMCLWAVRRTRHLALQLAAGHHTRWLRMLISGTGFIRGVTTSHECGPKCEVGFAPPSVPPVVPPRLRP